MIPCITFQSPSEVSSVLETLNTNAVGQISFQQPNFITFGFIKQEDIEPRSRQSTANDDICFSGNAIYALEHSPTW